MKRLTHYFEIGQIHSYRSIWDLQKELQSGLIQQKKKDHQFKPNFLLFCEHAPVYTLGKSGDIDHFKQEVVNEMSEKPDFFKINRGGDITFHGPGQITGYPIFDMDQFYHDLHRYVRDLEEAVILCLSKLGIAGSRIPGLTGVWVVDDDQQKRKICAIGVHMSRWVSMHGFALNVQTDLAYYDGIVPCGINDEDKTVTSIRSELGETANMGEVKKVLKQSFQEVFSLSFI